MASLLSSILFPAPSLFMAVMTILTLGFMATIGLLEVIGKHLQYSKFWNVNTTNSERKQSKISSRNGMLLLYTPAFLAAFASFWIVPQVDLRFLLLKFALTVHFFKRDLEVLLVHKYSGGMGLDSAIIVSLAYFSAAANMIYAQHLAQGLPEPAVDLKYAGVVIFLVGIFGNFYHHHLLACLRTKGGDKGYKIPKGGLFGLVICPHYLFEIVGFLGISYISQTWYGFAAVVGVTMYLMGRSYVTRKWYLSKFDNFPRNVRALIPFVF